MRIARREWALVALYALLLIALTTAPYLLAWATQDADRVFGGFLIGAEDGNSYVGKMRLGARGIWEFPLFYTAEEHPGASLIFLPYILPGQIIRLFVGEDDPRLTGTLLFVFHTLRVVFDFLLIVVIYRFIAAFLRAPAARITALALATLGGGVGWLLSLIGQSHFLGTLPPDFYIPEGFTFIILFSLPHLALARAALLGGFLALFGERGLRTTAVAGLCWLVVGLAVPFYLVIIYCLLTVWMLAIWLRRCAFPLTLFVRCALAAGMTLPLFAYFAAVFSSNPAFAQWSAQNALPSPHPLHYLLAYGILGALAVVGGRWAWQRGDVRHLLLVSWVVVVPILVYLPINVQRRMAEAVLVPLAILATAGLRLLSRRRTSGFTQSWRRMRNLTLLTVVPSSLFLLFGGVLAALHPDRPLFYPAAEAAAFEWLNAHAEPDAVVLSSKTVGNLIPAWTGLRVLVGHGPETLDAVSKEALVERFYRDELTADERRALYETMRIRYVFYGAAERALSGAMDAPAWQDGLNLIYDLAGYRIYEVVRHTAP